MRFRVNTLGKLSRMICGDRPSPFPYRSSSYLTSFFEDLDLHHRHDGSTRGAWVRSVLEELNTENETPPHLPSPELCKVVQHLLHPEHFIRTRDEDVDRDTALKELNEALRIYDLAVVLDGRHGLPRLVATSANFVSTTPESRERERVITFCPSVFSVPKVDQDPRLVSVMMPFAAEFRPVYRSIRAAAKACNLDCQRADDLWENSTFMQDIFDLIFRARVVVVDFSGRNPNVMYETGIAHTLGKIVVPITQTLSDVPSDLQQHRVLKYLPNEQGFVKLEETLATRLATILAT